MWFLPGRHEGQHSNPSLYSSGGQVADTIADWPTNVATDNPKHIVKMRIPMLCSLTRSLQIPRYLGRDQK